MLIVTTESIPGKTCIPISLVKGSTIQTKNIFKDFGSMIKTLIGGELIEYTKMMDTARQLATQKMLSEAEQLGADAIVAVRYSSSSVMAGAAEMMVYGTAVRFQ